MLKYIFVVLLLGAMWAVVLVFKFPMWWAILGSAVVVGILLLYLLIKFLVAKSKAKKLEGGLQDSQQNARPDLQAEVQALQGEFLRAIQALKSSGVRGKGAQALYALPWYVMVGPPGAGKSTAMRNSGLRFPYKSSSGQVGSVQGVGGTRNCEWWMTNQGIILDTAGRYMTEESDRDEWLAFLDLIRENRPKRPINGLIVAVDVSEIGFADATTIERQATDIRRRIDEITQHLEMSAPIYVMFTKCDLLPGFTETFHELNKTERGQIWGFTVPSGRLLRSPAEEFAAYFDDLQQLLEGRCFQRLLAERTDEAKQKIYSFPQHFALLRNTLAYFVGALFAESVYAESLRLRGAYFTSGTQEGAPIDRVMSSVAQAMGLPPGAPATAIPPNEARSYFLGDMFSRIVFPDRNLAHRSKAHLKKRLRKEQIAAGGIGAVALATAITPIMSVQENSRMQTQLQGCLSKLNEQNPSAELSLQDVLCLHKQQQTLELHEEEGTPIGMTWGMYQGDHLHKNVDHLLFYTLQRDLVRGGVSQNLAMMGRFADNFGSTQQKLSDRDYAEYHRRLHAYLLLTKPKQPTKEPKPKPESEEWNFLVDYLAKEWKRPISDLRGGISEEETKELAGFYTTYLSEHPDLRISRKDVFTSQMREILRQTDQDEALVWQLVESLNGAGFDIQLKHIMKTSYVESSGNKIVRGAYTRRGWDRVVRERLEQIVDHSGGAGWVIGVDKSKPAERLRRIASLRDKYFRGYIREWRQFIESIRVQAPQDPMSARQLYADLTRGSNPPYRSLFAHVAWNATLREKPQAADKAAGEVGDAVGKAAARGASKKISSATGVRIGADTLSGIGQSQLEILGGRMGYFTNRKVLDELSGFFLYGASMPSLLPPAEGQEDGPGGPQSGVELDNYQARVDEIRQELRNFTNNGGSPGPLAKMVRSARDKTESEIEGQKRSWKNAFNEVLIPPFEQLSIGLGESISGSLEDAWCQKIVKPFEARFSGRYPFRRSRRDVDMEDFVDYFHPENGKLWTFQKEFLSAYIEREGSEFSHIKQRGRRKKKQVSANVLRFLTSAYELSDSMFPEGRDEVYVEFEAKMLARSGITRMVFSVDNKSIEYNNGRERGRNMRWPGDPKNSGASLRTSGPGLRGDLRQPGPWGLFRIMEQGQVTGSAGQPRFYVQWDLRSQGAQIVKMEFTPGRSTTPFFGIPGRSRKFMDIFRNRHLRKPPLKLFPGSKKCSNR